MTADGAEERIETRLRDGTRVLIRTVEPTDKPGFVAGLDRLSPRSRYLRFHTGLEQLSAQQLAYLTEVDQVDHVAWVAIDIDDPDAPGIGVARFVRLADEPTVAEAAITVLDEYQGRGLGTLLLSLLAESAVERGVETFRAYVLGENSAILRVFDRLGPRYGEQQRGVFRIDVDLTTGQNDAETSTAAKVFRAITGHQLPPLHTTTPPVWLGYDDAGGAERSRLRALLDRMLDRTRSARDGGVDP